MQQEGYTQRLSILLILMEWLEQEEPPLPLKKLLSQTRD